jgi:hypothetical protein
MTGRQAASREVASGGGSAGAADGLSAGAGVAGRSGGDADAAADRGARAAGLRVDLRVAVLAPASRARSAGDHARAFARYPHRIHRARGQRLRHRPRVQAVGLRARPTVPHCGLDRDDARRRRRRSCGFRRDCHIVRGRLRGHSSLRSRSRRAPSPHAGTARGTSGTDRGRRSCSRIARRASSSRMSIESPNAAANCDSTKANSCETRIETNSASSNTR